MKCPKRSAKNELAKKCQRLIKIGIICGDITWPLADQKKYQFST